MYFSTNVSNRGRWHLEVFKNSSSGKNVVSCGICNSNSPVVKALNYHSSVESLLVSLRFLSFSHMILLSDTSSFFESSTHIANSLKSINNNHKIA